LGGFLNDRRNQTIRRKLDINTHPSSFFFQPLRIKRIPACTTEGCVDWGETDTMRRR
jgi:hypothetical protein